MDLKELRNSKTERFKNGGNKKSNPFANEVNSWLHNKSKKLTKNEI